MTELIYIVTSDIFDSIKIGMSKRNILDISYRYSAIYGNIELYYFLVENAYEKEQDIHKNTLKHYKLKKHNKNSELYLKTTEYTIEFYIDKISDILYSKANKFVIKPEPIKFKIDYNKILNPNHILFNDNYKILNINVENALQNNKNLLSDIKCNNYIIQLEMIENIKSWLGLKNTQEYGKKITREHLQSVLEKFKENKEKIYTVFHLRKDRSKKFDVQTCQTLIKKVFEKWGYSTLSKDMSNVHKPMLDGKRVDMTPYVLENIICLESTKQMF